MQTKNTTIEDINDRKSCIGEQRLNKHQDDQGDEEHAALKEHPQSG